MTRLVRLYLVSILIGFALALAFTALLLLLDVAGLRNLVLGSSSGWLGALMLVFFNTILFAGVQFGIAVMRMAEPEEPRGGRRVRRLPMIPAPVTAPARGRSRP
ncbi:hypothetical protein [Paracoccus marinaquae]|uniref:Uncharacterized protein n=1 Tax=Paracoccus marinaquae TaxID=2841926 RepID=A0ABS6AI56_9RHOB|nr:hypothetical protein [Paracoccus marinaquae]MBU3030290.1 hypothetical protein [Paracoccus marinaquae]